MTQNLTVFPPVTVAYFRYVGPYGVTMKGVWEQLNAWLKTHPQLWTEASSTFGISHDNPMTTPPELCRYDACVEVPGTIQVDEGALRAELVGGQYVTLPFHGTPEQVAKGFERVFGLVYKLGKTVDLTRPVFERYPHNCCIEPDGSFTCDLCVPVK